MITLNGGTNHCLHQQSLEIARLQNRITQLEQALAASNAMMKHHVQIRQSQERIIRVQEQHIGWLLSVIRFWEASAKWRKRQVS